MLKDGVSAANKSIIKGSSLREVVGAADQGPSVWEDAQRVLGQGQCHHELVALDLARARQSTGQLIEVQ